MNTLIKILGCLMLYLLTMSAYGYSVGLHVLVLNNTKQTVIKATGLGSTTLKPGSTDRLTHNYKAYFDASNTYHSKIHVKESSGTTICTVKVHVTTEWKSYHLEGVTGELHVYPPTNSNPDRYCTVRVGSKTVITTGVLQFGINVRDRP